MKTVVFDKIGSPLDVLRLDPVPIPEIADNEVLVKMISASINPGDFLFIQNLYPEPKKPRFPEQIAGNAGAGVIAKAGKKVLLKPGTLVAFYYYNAWAEYAAIPADWLIPMPASLPLRKPVSSRTPSRPGISFAIPECSRDNGLRSQRATPASLRRSCNSRI